MTSDRFKPIVCLLLAGASAVAVAADGQDYPNRPIRFVTAAIGGGIDFTARMLAHGLTERLKQQVVVDNRGGTSIAEQTVAKGTPDGYTLLVHNNTVWVSTLLGPVPYEHEKELAPISLLSRSPNILVVHPSLQANTVKELIERAKAAPGEINYASGPVGAANHLAAELFNALAGVKLVRIGYKGGGPALNDVLAGQVKVMFATTGSVSGHVKSGRLKGLAVTSAEPSPLAPGLPTVAASGVPGYAAEAIYGFWAPARTPPAILALLNREAVAVLNTPEVKQRFFNAGVESVGTKPQEFAATIKSETQHLGAVIKKAGLRVQ
ncbi:MAG TPA: tripartite tricarboxylate transporter substrate binding protein [Burkholderiales bacterium]|nr:tripartite tricarboxylate transporter substrate binding protein [Burkholderiales bacterium]